MNNRVSKTSILVYTIIILILSAASAIQIYDLIINEKKIGSSLLFLLFPIIAALTGKLIQSIIGYFTAGEYSATASRVFSMLGWGLSIFFFFFFMPGETVLNKASIGIPFLVLVITANVCILPYFGNYPIIFRICKGACYLFLGFITSRMISAIWLDGIWNLGLEVSISKIIFFGFAFITLAKLLWIMEISSNNYLAVLGKWCGDKSLRKFFTGCLIAFFVYDILLLDSDSLPTVFVYIKWLLVLLFILIAFISLFSRVKRDMSVSDYNGKLGKHVQEIVYNKSYDEKELNMIIDEYIINGDLYRLIPHIVSICQGSMISNNAIGKIIKPLLINRDIPTPKFFLQHELIFIEKKNIETRKALISRVVIEIEDYGRSHKYNEYRRNTINVQ